MAFECTNWACGSPYCLYGEYGLIVFFVIGDCLRICSYEAFDGLDGGYVHCRPERCGEGGEGVAF